MTDSNGTNLSDSIIDVGWVRHAKNANPPYIWLQLVPLMTDSFSVERSQDCAVRGLFHTKVDQPILHFIIIHPIQGNMTTGQIKNSRQAAKIGVDQIAPFIENLRSAVEFTILFRDSGRIDLPM